MTVTITVTVGLSFGAEPISTTQKFVIRTKECTVSGLRSLAPKYRKGKLKSVLPMQRLVTPTNHFSAFSNIHEQFAQCFAFSVATLVEEEHSNKTAHHFICISTERQ